MYTRKTIPDQAYVCEYAGEVIANRECERRIMQNPSKLYHMTLNKTQVRHLYMCDPHAYMHIRIVAHNVTTMFPFVMTPAPDRGRIAARDACTLFKS